MIIKEEQKNTENHNEIQLNGHSGCHIILINDNNSIYVKKKSSNNNYNIRLKRQCEKQLKFIQNEEVKTPQIYKKGYEGKLFYFNMEYVKGKTLSEYIEEMNVQEIPYFIKCLFKCLYIEEKKKHFNASKIFLNKIEKLHNETKEHGQLKESFTLLKNYDWTKVHRSFCHGDLTLENILITRNKKIYLIDFLDSFYNSWQIDIAKLLQDLELQWSFRNKTESANRNIRLKIAKEALINEIRKTKDGENNIETIYNLLLLNVIRIYPYTKDSKTLNFLDKQILFLNKKLTHKEEIQI